MQTTYDNSWMYPNRRHDNVQNTQKNDSYNYAVLTDRYKNVQTGSHPRDPNNIIAPQTNVASSLQNEQQRTATTHWPTSNYFQSAYTNNFYTENAYTPQTSNINYVSQNTQSQQICDMRYPQTHNVDFTHTPSNSHVSTVISGSNDNTPRIRVKDVFSLNNNSLHDPFLSSHSHQTYSKTQDDYFTNYGRRSYNKTEINEAQSEFIDIQKLSLTQAGPSLSYTQRQELCNTSNTVYQGSGEYSSGNQIQSGRSRVIAVDLGEKAQNPQTDSSDVCCGVSGGVREKVIANIPSDEINLEVERNRRLIQRIPISGNNAQQHNICDTTEANLFIHNSVTTSTNVQYQTTINQTTPNQTTTNQTTTNRTTTNYTTTNQTTTSQTTQNQALHIHNQRNNPPTTIKIIIPHTSKSSVINMNTTGTTKDSSSLSLPCLLESNNIYISPGSKEGSNQGSGKEKSFTLSLPQPVQENSNNTQSLGFVSDVNNSFLSPGQSQRLTDNTFRNTVITSQRNISRTTEPLIDVNRENIIRFLNSTTSNTSIGNYNENVPREAVFKGTVLSSSFTSEPENMDKNIENVPEQSVSEGNIFEQNIKMEEYTIEDSPDNSLQQECESQISVEEKLPTLSLIDDDEPLVGFTDAEDPENCIEESGILEGRSSARSDTIEDGCQEQQERAGLNQDNYKSEINRDKLHMLIQFIKKEDEEPICPSSSKSPTNKISDNSNKDEEVSDLNQDRRKLSKTSLVKNKNNSRDLVSLNKIARAELLKSSSSSPLSLSGCDTNSDKSEEEKTEHSMQYNPSQENSTEKEGSLKSDSFNMNKSIKEQAGCSSGMLQKRKRDVQEEKDVTFMTRALRAIPEYFCMSCNLSSPMSSFWINVVSSELRCITCFEKMALRSIGVIRKSKSSGSDRTLSEKDSSEMGKAVNEKSQERVGSLGEQNKSEQPRKEKTIKSKHGSSKDVKTSEKAKTEKLGQTGKKSNVKEDTHKVKSSGISSKTSCCGKTKGKDSTSSEEIVEKPKKTKISSKDNSTSSKSHSSNHSKQVSEYKAKDKRLTSDEVSGKSIRKSFSKEEEITDERKDTKRVTDPVEKSGKKAKESSHKERSAERSKSSKTKSHSPSKEFCTCHKVKLSEQSNSSETKPKSTSSSSSEKNKQAEQSRKRKNSDESCIPHKVRKVEGHSKKEIKQVHQPTDKSKVSKDETVSHKSKDHDKSKSSSEKSRRHSSTKEDENLRKDTKQVCDSCDKSKSSHHKIKTSESIKQKERHSTDEKVGKKTKENLESQKPGSSKEHTKSETKQSAESSGGHSKKNQKQEPSSVKKEGKQGSSGMVTKEKPYEKEKEKKQFVGKIPKLSEKSKPRRVGRPRKIDETWTPSKEKNKKVKKPSSSVKPKKRESQEEKTEKKAKETAEKKAKETTEKRSDTRKEEERNAEKKAPKKNQTEKSYPEDSDDSTESETSKRETQSLLKKLMKKTRKLSLTLLKEAE